MAKFSLHLSDNITQLQRELANQSYRHGKYSAFKINDPKLRDIHKASVKDRLVHHAVYRVLYPYFDRQFIHDSYSCRKNKGTHRAIERFKTFSNQVSRNRTKTVWVLKCDISKFFANIDHKILKNILSKHIDSNSVWLLSNIIDSFHTTNSNDVGLPLGNLTSQLLVNAYMNEFDQYVKRVLKVKHYVRYADDFVILSADRLIVDDLLPQIELFLTNKLALDLNPRKVQIRTFASGIDFLGWVHFPDHRVLRPTTQRRAIRQIQHSHHSHKEETYQSYIGLLNNGNCYKTKLVLDNLHRDQNIDIVKLWNRL